MPEGHTVHRAARQQNRLFGGHRVAVSSPQGRFAAGAARVDGAVLERVEAYGKHLFQHWDNDAVLHVHLGLYGRLRVQRTAEPAPPRGLIRMRMSAEHATLDLSGPTVCAVGTVEDRDRVVARLGPDPLRPAADPDRFVRRVIRSSARIGTLVMDQSVISGIGNVYRAEGLFLAGIHPDRPGRSLSADVVGDLWSLFRRLLTNGVRRGRIETVVAGEPAFDPSDTDGSARLYVYRRQRCRRCGTTVQRWELQGRTCYACPGDQS